MGKVGQDLTTEEGYRAAQLCALGILQAVHSIAGLDNRSPGRQGLRHGQRRPRLQRYTLGHPRLQ